MTLRLCRFTQTTTSSPTAQILQDYVELSEQQLGDSIQMVLNPYTDRTSQQHLKRVKELLQHPSSSYSHIVIAGTPSQLGLGREPGDPASIHDGFSNPAAPPPSQRLPPLSAPSRVTRTPSALPQCLSSRFPCRSSTLPPRSAEESKETCSTWWSVGSSPPRSRRSRVQC